MRTSKKNCDCGVVEQHFFKKLRNCDCGSASFKLRNCDCRLKKGCACPPLISYTTLSISNTLPLEFEVCASLVIYDVCFAPEIVTQILKSPPILIMSTEGSTWLFALLFLSGPVKVYTLRFIKEKMKSFTEEGSIRNVTNFEVFPSLL